MKGLLKRAPGKRVLHFSNEHIFTADRETPEMEDQSNVGPTNYSHSPRLTLSLLCKNSDSGVHLWRKLIFPITLIEREEVQNFLPNHYLKYEHHVI